ncbi:glycerate kinase type-2 family protein [Aliikangiella maris]|uniref:DUF4147 domain-containing protein n=2 Tax=Aliikangiella maris TaxID=3162458 RepID=A0ABV3MJZ9_9GAMM
MNQTIKNQLIQLWQAGVNAVSGKQAVIQAFKNHPDFQPDLIIAVGKAASGMCLGALDAISAPCPAIVVTKYHHTDPQLSAKPDVEIIESAHPVPDENSLLGGKTILQAVSQMSENSKLLLLVSGGASALSECLPEETGLQDLQKITNEMLASGQSIAAINAKRKALSQIKDGKLLAQFKGLEALVFAISDVEGDDIQVIGSGTGDSRLINHKAQSQIIASNKIARDAVCAAAQTLNLPVNLNQETLYDDVFSIAPKIADALTTGQPGVYLWGGEPTIQLPANPGNGGRNQSLALAVAKEIQGKNNIHLLVAGTDGTDGPTDAAGGIINGQTFLINSQQAERDLQNANAGAYLRETDSIFISGPTNTNVMDLAIAIIE